MTTPSHPRLPDWQPRLQALIQARLAAPFAWGEHDCCLFVCDAVQAITGQDLSLLLAAWGTPNAQVDLTGDGQVDGNDMAVLLAGWGSCAQ